MHPSRFKHATAVGYMILFTGLISSVSTAEPVADAKQFVDQLHQGDYEAAVKTFDETMAKAMPPKKLAGVWGQLLKLAGPFREQQGTRIEKNGNFDVVHVTCAFEKQKLVAKVVFNDQGKISGLWIGPPTPDAKYSPPKYADESKFTEREVTVGMGEWQLPGTLTLPVGDGPFSAVVLVHGSGPQDRDETIGPNKVFKDLAWGLASKGIAVLRYEKRTKAHGPKFAQLKSFTLKEEVTDDALLALQCLRSQPEIDAKRVFVLGHSLGGTLAPRIAEQDGNVAGIILLAAAVRPLEELIIEQFEYLAKLDGSVTEEERQQIDKMAKAVARVTDPQLTPDVPADQLPFGIAASYWLDLRDYRPDAVARQLTLPMLILQGDRDYQVTPHDFALWKKSLAENEGVTFRDFPSLNHLFGKGTGPSTPAEYDRRTPVDREVIDTISQWITSLKR